MYSQKESKKKGLLVKAINILEKAQKQNDSKNAIYLDTYQQYIPQVFLQDLSLLKNSSENENTAKLTISENKEGIFLINGSYENTGKDEYLESLVKKVLHKNK